MVHHPADASPSSIHWTRDGRLYHRSTSSPSHSLTSSTSLLPYLSSIRTSEKCRGRGTRAALCDRGVTNLSLSISKRQNFEMMIKEEVRAVDPGRLGWCRLPARPDPATPGAGVVGLQSTQRPSRAPRGGPGYGSPADAVNPVLRRGQFRSY